MWHDTRSAAGFIPAGGMVEPDRHAENPDTKRRFRNLLAVSGLLEKLVEIAPRMASEDEVLRVHGREYLERVKKLSAENGGDAGVLTPFGPGSYEIALLSAGGAIAAVDAVLDARVQSAYALIRPPGHHAEADQGMGFCIFSNAAIAAQPRARACAGSRAWRSSTGTCTTATAARARSMTDPTVLTISVHQDNYFPRGARRARGRRRGRGSRLQPQRAAAAGLGPRRVRGGVRARGRAGAARASARSSSSSRRASTAARWIRSAACSRPARPTGSLDAHAASRSPQEVCGGRIALTHEGGYSTAHVPFCGLAVMEELSGISTGVVDPFLEFFMAIGGQALQPHQEAVIREAEKRLDLLR